MFHDETENVAKKASRGSSQGPSRASQITPESVEKAVDTGLRKPPSSDALPIALSPTLEREATRFFFEYFTVEQNMDRMTAMYTSISPAEKSGGKALINSIRALGLAGLSTVSDRSQLMPMAEGQYLKAIRVMNSALFDAKEAKDDKTLLAVMILTIFEMFMNRENHNLGAWGNHIQGAAALLEARGKEQFQTKEGLRLFVQAAVPICTNCMQLATPLPATMSSLMAEALRVGDANETVLLLLDHKLRFVTFYNSVRSRKTMGSIQIVHQAKQLDDELIGILGQIGVPWKYTTIQADPDNELTFPGHCHVFEHFFGAERWNGAWASRLLLNQMIRSILLIGFTSRPPTFVDKDYTILFQEATNNLYQIQNDVAATVPQYLGRLPIVDESKGKKKEPLPFGTALSSTPAAVMTPKPLSRAPTPTVPTAAAPSSKAPRFFWQHFGPIKSGLSLAVPTSGTSTLPVVRATGGAMLPWILFLLATTDIATDELKTWVEKRLNEMSHEFGIHQSLILADRLRSGSINYAWYRDPWRTPAEQASGAVSPEMAIEIGEADLG